MSLYGETTEAKRLQVDATSLADLKAELFRKKGEAVKNKLQGNYRPEKAQNKADKKTNIWSKENTGIIARNMRDMEKRKEEERSMERVRYMLQKKEGLYNSLKKGKGNSVIAENFLVNFGGRDDSDEDDVGRDYPATSDGEQWVEYVDALGRTRSCMKKDLPSLKRQDKEMVREDTEEQETGQGLRKEEPDMLSADVRMDDLRQKWEQQEMENLEKSNLHYSDVRFDEARAHGAGFYNFSREEEKRSKEQETLKKFHEESEETRKQKEKKADKKKKEMADRIKKIKAKKRQKLGLPPLSDDESDNETKNAEDSDSEDDPNEDISKSVMEGLKMFRRDNEEMERQRNSAMRVASSTSRDWDKAKEVQEDDLGRSKEWKVMTQDQWVGKKRTERKSEFAPPSAYGEARFIIKNREEKMAQAQAEKRKMSTQPSPSQPPVKKPVQSQSQPQNWGYPPPNMQFPFPPPGPGPYPPFYASPPPPPPGVRPPNPPPNLDPMAVLDASSSNSASFTEDLTPDPSLLKPSIQPPPSQGPSYSKCVRMELHKRMKDQDFLPPPSNTGGLNSKILEAFNESDSDEEEEDTKRGTGAEVAPPCDMDYYSYTGGAKTDRSGYRSHHDMADAFNAGLKANKKD